MLDRSINYLENLLRNRKRELHFGNTWRTLNYLMATIGNFILVLNKFPIRLH